jgi:hypothetical protein
MCKAECAAAASHDEKRRSAVIHADSPECHNDAARARARLGELDPLDAFTPRRSALGAA